MSKNKKSEENVLIYALYEDNYYDDNYSESMSISCEKEEEIKKYCEEKQYKITEIVRNSKSNYLAYNLRCFLTMLQKYQSIHHAGGCIRMINKIILYDIYDLCTDIHSFNVFYSLVNYEYIELETIKQGIISRNSFNELEVFNNEKE